MTRRRELRRAAKRGGHFKPSTAFRPDRPRGGGRRRHARVMLEAGGAAVLVVALGVVGAVTLRASPDAHVAVGAGSESDSKLPASSTPTTVQSEQASPTGPPPTTPASSPQPAPTSSTVVVDPETMVPPGVAEQFDYYEMGDPPCPLLDIETGPTIDVESGDPAWVLARAILCLRGFDRHSPIDVTVTRPDGQTLALPYDPEIAGIDLDRIESQVTFMVDVDAPTGPYSVTAQQDTSTAHAVIFVSEPMVPRLRVVSDEGSDPLTVWAAGLAPGEAALIDVYVADDPTSGFYDYAKTIELPAPDARGRAVYTVARSLLATESPYCLVARGGSICEYEGKFF